MALGTLQEINLIFVSFVGSILDGWHCPGVDLFCEICRFFIGSS